MSDIGADLDAAVEMVHAAESRLLARNPNHELIAYSRIEDEQAREAAWQKLLRSYSRNPSQEGNVRGSMELTYALTQYLVALEVVLGISERVQTSLSAKAEVSGPIFSLCKGGGTDLEEKLPF